MAGFPPSRYDVNTIYAIPARSGVAIPLKQNQSIKVINTHGAQVVDTWAVLTPRTSTMNFTTSTRAATQIPAYEFMSMCHTRASTLHLSPLPDDKLLTNTRKPILQMIEDATAPHCVHDTLIAACDIMNWGCQMSSTTTTVQIISGQVWSVIVV